MLNFFLLFCSCKDTPTQKNDFKNNFDTEREKITDSIYVNTEKIEKRIQNANNCKEVTISDCIFEKLHSDNWGGALSISGSATKLKISKTGFKICYSIGEGGAISFRGSSFNISSSCFLGCIAKSGGQAISVTNSESFVKGCILRSSVMQCGPTKSVGDNSVILTKETEQIIGMVNQSFNNIEGIGACLCLGQCKYLALSYSFFGHNKGVNMFWLHETRLSDSISQCNIVENNLNNVNGESTLIFLEKGHLTVNGVTFINNKLDTYFYGGTFELNGLVFDEKKSNVLTKKEASFKVSGCYFEAKNAKMRPMNEINTWYCWALGENMPSTPNEVKNLQGVFEDEISGSKMMIILSLIGIASSFVGYVLIGNKKPVEEPVAFNDFSSLNPVGIVEL